MHLQLIFSPSNLPPGSFPNPAGNAETLGTITKTSYPTVRETNSDADLCIHV